MKQVTQIWLIFAGIIFAIYKMFDLQHKIEHLKRGQPDFHPTALSEYLVQRIKQAEKDRGASAPNASIDKQNKSVNLSIVDGHFNVDLVGISSDDDVPFVFFEKPENTRAFTSHSTYLSKVLEFTPTKGERYMIGFLDEKLNVLYLSNEVTA